MLGTGVGLLGVGCRQRAPIGGGGDTTAPGTITTFAFVEMIEQELGSLSVDAMPGNDGFGGGDISAYEIRGTDVGPIANETDWANAYVFDGPWTPAVGIHPNQPMSFTVGMNQGTTYYAIRCKDAAGNVSAISNIVTVTI